MYLDILACIAMFYVVIAVFIKVFSFIKSIILKQNDEALSKKDIILSIILKIAAVVILGIYMVRQICRVIEHF
jgi:hypothetical protein